jgi:hypothetical protein
VAPDISKDNSAFAFKDTVSKKILFELPNPEDEGIMIL